MSSSCYKRDCRNVSKKCGWYPSTYMYIHEYALTEGCNEVLDVLADSTVCKRVSFAETCSLSLSLCADSAI